MNDYTQLRAAIARGLPSHLWIDSAKTSNPVEYVGDGSARSDELQYDVNIALQAVRVLLAEVDALRAEIARRAGGAT